MTNASSITASHTKVRGGRDAGLADEPDGLHESDEHEAGEGRCPHFPLLGALPVGREKEERSRGAGCRQGDPQGDHDAPVGRVEEGGHDRASDDDPLHSPPRSPRSYEEDHREGADAGDLTQQKRLVSGGVQVAGDGVDDEVVGPEHPDGAGRGDRDSEEHPPICPAHCGRGPGHAKRL